MPENLTFDQFQKLNHTRSINAYCDSWPTERWMLALAGEAGEAVTLALAMSAKIGLACNMVKKNVRGDYPLGHIRAELLKELADVICYADLTISALGGNTGDTILDKFTEVSKRIDWKPKHKPGCRELLAREGACAIECEHGYDCCPICDPCDCLEKK